MRLVVQPGVGIRNWIVNLCSRSQHNQVLVSKMCFKLYNDQFSWTRYHHCKVISAVNLQLKFWPNLHIIGGVICIWKMWPLFWPVLVQIGLIFSHMPQKAHGNTLETPHCNDTKGLSFANIWLYPAKGAHPFSQKTLREAPFRATRCPTPC
jgi:hypothetical protein